MKNFNDLEFKISINGANLTEEQKSLIQVFREILLRRTLLCLDQYNSELNDET